MNCAGCPTLALQSALLLLHLIFIPILLRRPYSSACTPRSPSPALKVPAHFFVTLHQLAFKHPVVIFPASAFTLIQMCLSFLSFPKPYTPLTCANRLATGDVILVTQPRNYYRSHDPLLVSQIIFLNVLFLFDILRDIIIFLVL